MIKHILYGLRNAIIGFLTGVAIFFAVELLWWEFFPYQTADVFVPISVTNQDNIVKRGEKLQLALTINKQSDYNPTISRNILCEDNVYLVFAQGAGGSTRPRGVFTAETSYNIPDAVPANTPCTFIFINEYKVNPIRTITKVWASETFEVVE